MKYILIVILALFSTALYADAIDDARLVLDTLSGKTLTAPQTLSIVNRYNTFEGFSNPWDQTDNPVEYAAWPTNLERATFFLADLRGEIRGKIGRIGGNEYDATSASARSTAIADVEDEL